MVQCQVFGGAAIVACVSVPSQDVLPPHTLSIASAEGEEIVHEASGRVHRWLIGEGLLLVFALTVPPIAFTVCRGFLENGFSVRLVTHVFTVTVAIRAPAAVFFI